MSSIQIQHINGYHYAYEVTYARPGKRHWKYLGKPHEVSDQLTNEQRNELREERSIGQFQVSAEPDLQRRAIANEVRDDLIERYGEYVLSPDDDRRTTEIKLSGDAPENIIETVEGEAEEMINETETIGQEPLTDAEKDHPAVDFSEQSVFYYRSAKADLLNEGIDNWADQIDPTQVEDPQSYSDELSESDRSGGKRIDEYQSGTDTQSQTKTDDENERRALKEVANDGIGADEATEVLVDEFGYSSPAEVEAEAEAYA